MKSTLGLILLGAVLMIVAVASTSTYEMAEADPSASIYQYTFTSDTITDTEADTLTLPVLLYSKWDYNWTVTTTQESGTTDITAKLYESHLTSGDGWYQLTDTLALSGATDLDRLTGSPVAGVRQRIILTGAGTQSTTYTVKAIYKKY